MRGQSHALDLGDFRRLPASLGRPSRMTTLASVSSAGTHITRDFDATYPSAIGTSALGPVRDIPRSEVRGCRRGRGRGRDQVIIDVGTLRWSS